MDYNETYALILKIIPIRVLLSLVAHFDPELHQMEVVTAFLIGELKEEIYLELPNGIDCYD